ncbi:glycosyltransferase family 32 protein [Apiospora aurea]|uniref:Glycosyltransferase family 32 protein n=1 Tax=Apiospora aurea TaxID=335848 RepID=A0ABR1Q4Y8_9PEZI
MPTLNLNSANLCRGTRYISNAFKGHNRRPLIVLALWCLACWAWLCWEHLLVTRPSDPPHSANYRRTHIPRTIWQIQLPMPEFIPATGTRREGHATSWMHHNPYYTYTRLSIDDARQFLQTHYADRPEYLKTYDDLQNPALKSDLLRYLVLAKAGGVYSDLDTKALKPVDNWIPEPYRPHARLLIGFEWDQRDQTAPRWYTYPIQFQQWSIAAAPGHPLLQQMLEYTHAQLQNLSTFHNTTLGSLHFTDEEIWTATGPRAWTETIWRYLRDNEGLANLTNLSYLEEPRLMGDVLIYPINAFGSGQGHSGSYRWFTPKDGLVKHYFHGSWRVQM